MLVYYHNLIFYLLREKKYVVKHWKCNIAFIQVLKQVAHAKHLSDRFAFNQNSRTYSRCLNKFQEFQLCIMGGRQLKFIEMLETRSEDYQEIQEDIVSMLVIFLTEKDHFGD